MNYNLINTAAQNRVGMRQVFDSLDYLPLSSDLIQSDSNLLLNTVSEVFLKAEVIDQLLEFAEGFNVPAWDNTTNYGQAGQKIVILNVNGKDQAFVSIANSSEDNIDKDPLTETAFWETFLSFRLKQYRQSAIHEVINELSTVKELSANTPVVKNNDRLWYVNSTPEIMTKQANGAFRCVNIIPNTTNSIQLEVFQVGLKIADPQTFRMYLYHSDGNEPLQTFEIEITAADAGNFVWKDLVDTDGNPLRIQTLGDTNAGGLFVFGFYESDISGDFFSWEYNFYGTGYPLLTTRNQVNYFAWKEFAPYYSFYPGFYDQGLDNKPNIPDLGQYFDQGDYDEELPFNIKLKITEDHTNILLDNITRLDKLIQLKWAILLLEDMMMSFRRNGDADKADQINIILNRSVATEGTQGNFTETSSQGVISRYTNELKSAKKNLTALTTNNFGLVRTF